MYRSASIWPSVHMEVIITRGGGGGRGGLSHPVCAPPLQNAEVMQVAIMVVCDAGGGVPS